MLLESKEGVHTNATDRRQINYYGSLTVTGSGCLKIPCRGRPWEVEVGFSDPVPPKPGCGPDTDDAVEIEIDHLLHPFPIWAIKICWDIHSGNIREIVWRATVIR